MKTAIGALCLALSVNPALAFSFQASCRGRSSCLALNAGAADMTAYMAKAHEDKLRAIQEAEAKKNAEIQGLQKEIKALKAAPGALVTSTAPASGMDLADMSKEDLAHKLLQYQQFMAKYIIDAQQAKAQAVLAAEAAAATKYGANLLPPSTETSKKTVKKVEVKSAANDGLFESRNARVAASGAAGKSRWDEKEVAKASGASSSTAPPANGATQASSGPPKVAVVHGNTVLYEKRSARVAAAGSAGKSRWDELEIKKSAEVASSPTSVTSPVIPAVVTVPITPEVEAADHGLRSDGGVGGPSLAERVNFGAQLVGGSPLPTSTTTSSPTPGSTNSLYDQRNARVAASAKAGKSRWDDMEIQKATELAGSSTSSASSPTGSPARTATVTPEIEAADHGLRNDGGVSGPSLAERVNFGAAIVGR